MTRAQILGRQELIVTEHQIVADGHDLAEHVSRHIFERHIVADALAHFLHAIRALEQRHRDDDLWFLSVISLQFSPHQEVEFLVGASQFDIGLQRHGIISLHERIQEFMNADRLLFLEALMKIIPLHHARDPIVRGQLDEVARCHGAHPSAVEFNQGLFLIENLEDLSLIGLGVVLHLRLGEDLSGFGHSGGVADQAGKIARSGK